MHTNKDRLDNKCTHREYYAQFVTTGLKNKVTSIIGLDRLLKSTDEHLNDIPLKIWDNIAAPYGTSELLKQCGDFLTLSGQVCIAKEAAKQLKESNQ